VGGGGVLGGGGGGRQGAFSYRPRDLRARSSGRADRLCFFLGGYHVVRLMGLKGKSVFLLLLGGEKKGGAKKGGSSCISRLQNRLSSHLKKRDRKKKVLNLKGEKRRDPQDLLRKKRTCNPYFIEGGSEQHPQGS